MKLLLELTDRHLDLIKGELRIPETHYEYLMRAFNADEEPKIPAEYEQSVRILKVRNIGLGLSNDKADCVIVPDPIKTPSDLVELEVVDPVVV